MSLVTSFQNECGAEEPWFGLGGSAGLVRQRSFGSRIREQCSLGLKMRYILQHFYSSKASR